MRTTIRHETTTHSNGQTTTRHRVVTQHSSVPDLDEQALSLDAISRKSNPPHPRVHIGGTQQQ